MFTYRSTALAAATMLAGMPLMAQDMPGDAEVIALSEWRYDDLYANGVSAENFIDRSVYGQNGEEIGDVEDLLIGPDGKVLSIIAEVGGFWDIGDTHVSVPIDQVEVSGDAHRVVVPVTEETVEDYAEWDYETLSADAASREVIEGVDDARAARAWRASELIGDRARFEEDADKVDFGYVNDLILRDGEVVAVVVQPLGVYGSGYRAYPYYGYNHGWHAGAPYYDMPYTEDDVSELGAFDYQRFDS